MSNSTPNPTNATSAADPTVVLQQTERELASLKAKLRSSSRMTCIVGLIILGLLSAYFYYGYSEINALLQPKEVVAATSSYIDDQLPAIREQLETQIKDNSEQWAQMVSDYAYEAIPELRLALEDFALKQLDEVFDQVASLTEEEFKKFLVDNRDLVETAFKELADNPKVSDELLAKLEAALEEELGVQMKDQAKDLLDTLEKLADEVEVLKEGKNLEELGAAKRRVLMLARRLQHDQGLASDGSELEILKPLQDAVKGAEAEKDAGE
jgi:hypothetical protein